MQAPCPDHTLETMTDARIQSSPCLQGERVAFTGTLASMTHKEAFDLVSAQGGIPMSSASGQTTMLVVGDEGWPLEADGKASQKFELIDALRTEGKDIRIVSESEWLHLLGLAERDEIHREYTPAMLSELLGVNVRSIRRWERLGLIRAVRRVHRLPYFDFREVATARRLSELLLEGVSAEQLQQTLASLGESLPGVERPLAQLNILVQDSELVLRDERGIMEATTGQRMFDFDGPDTEAGTDSSGVSIAFPKDETHERTLWTAEEWFYEGCRLADLLQPEAAVESFRMAMMAHGEARRGRRSGEAEQVPHPAEISFHLADALYRMGHVQAAIERYHSAVEHDPHYLEAWIQLGCLLAETGSSEKALDAFRIALDVHPDYPDANLHIANTYEQLGELEPARTHWQKYLQFDSRGPWAEHARQQLARTDSTEPDST